jgi:hypothetical protein
MQYKDAAGAMDRAYDASGSAAFRFTKNVLFRAEIQPKI